jgi:hypothetical protein
MVRSVLFMDFYSKQLFVYRESLVKTIKNKIWNLKKLEVLNFPINKFFLLLLLYYQTSAVIFAYGNFKYFYIGDHSKILAVISLKKSSYNLSILCKMQQMNCVGLKIE